MSYGDGFKVRVGVVVFKDDKLLLARQNNRAFWVFPGGTLEPGESLAECAVREIKEEANLDVRVEKLLYVADFMRPERQAIDVFFLATYLSGTLVMETSENLNEIAFLTRTEAEALQLQPSLAAEPLLRAWAAWDASRDETGQGKEVGCGIEGDLLSAFNTVGNYLGAYAPSF